MGKVSDLNKKLEIELGNYNILRGHYQRRLSSSSDNSDDIIERNEMLRKATLLRIASDEEDFLDELDQS